MKSLKILYISPSIKTASGGAVVSRRNRRLLCQIVGGENFYPIEIARKSNNPLKMLWDDLVERSFWGLDSTDKKSILQLIKKENISTVFLDSSKLGGLAELIRKCYTNVQIITFFHNVEVDFERVILKLSKKWHLAYRNWLAEYNEIRAIHSSDVIVCLNERDSAKLKEIYGRKADKIIPVTLDSAINENTMSRYKISDGVPHLLFFGSNFPPNVEGIKLFVDEVMPKVDAILTIAGAGMEQLKPHFQDMPRVEICGFVENVDELYQNADIVVLPIFSGAGMKVKTAEALKYGKYVLASNEALEGYNINSLKGIVRCMAIDDFVHAINCHIPQERFLLENRQFFLDYHSDESAKTIFEGIIEDLNIYKK